jgi:hypothetical protein
MISVSMIPGGNPVALEEPSQWATSYASCPVCHRLYCDHCMTSEPFCPDCPGPSAVPSRQFRAFQLTKMCRKRDEYTPSEYLDLAWAIVDCQQSTSEQIRTLQEILSPEVMGILSSIAADQVVKWGLDEPVETSEEPVAAEAEASEENDEALREWMARWPSLEFVEELANAAPDHRR